MDHDHEITKGSAEEVSKVQLFLRKSLLAIRSEDQKPYNLDVEFAKTRKNKDYFVLIILLSAAVVIIAGAWVITSRINESSRNVPVDITVFEDLNLKNVLDLAKKAEDTLNAKVQERNMLQQNHQADLANMRLQKKSELDIIAAQKLSDAERKQKNDAVEKAYASQEKKLKAAYQQKLAVVEASLAEARTQVESFDTKRVEEARSQKLLLNNQRDLYELEKKKLQEQYESEIKDLRKRMEVIQNENAKLKTDQITELINEYQSKIAALDPLFQDGEGDSYLKKVEVYPEAGIPFAAPPKNIPPSFEFTEDDFRLIGQGYTGLAYLLSKLSGIPFENEAGLYANAAKKMALLAGNANERIIGTSFSRLTQLRDELAEESQARKQTEALLEKTKNEALVSLDEAAKTIEAKDAELASAVNSLSDLKNALIAAATTGKYSGYVLAVANPESPKIFLLPEAETQVFSSDAPTVYIYRDRSTLIATIALSREGSEIVTSVAKLEKNRDIRVMDYLLLTKK